MKETETSDDKEETGKNSHVHTINERIRPPLLISVLTLSLSNNNLRLIYNRCGPFASESG